MKVLEFSLNSPENLSGSRSLQMKFSLPSILFVVAELSYLSGNFHPFDAGVALSNILDGGPRVVVSTAAFHARVRGSVPGLGGLKETKNVSSPSTCESQYCGEPP